MYLLLPNILFPKTLGGWDFLSVGSDTKISSDLGTPGGVHPGRGEETFQNCSLVSNQLNSWLDKGDQI